MRACWLLIAVAGCSAQTAQPVVMSNHAPGWQRHCAPLLEGSVHADASGVDRLAAPVDDDLRRCWKLAVRIVDAGRPVAPPPSCRALRVSDLRLSADWLARCRRFEAGAPTISQVATRSPAMRPPLLRRSLGAELFPAGRVVDFGRDSDRDGVPDTEDRCPDLAGDATRDDGCPRAVILRRAVVLGAIPLQSPAVPPYDLTPAAQTICAAVQDVVAHWTAAPNPTIPLTLAQRWTADRYEIDWPGESTIAPVEDALRTCLSAWTLDTTTTGDARALRWQKARFSVELRTSPERRLAIERR
jgi:hypothetical protein